MNKLGIWGIAIAAGFFIGLITVGSFAFAFAELEPSLTAEAFYNKGKIDIFFDFDNIPETCSGNLRYTWHIYGQDPVSYGVDADGKGSFTILPVGVDFVELIVIVSGNCVSERFDLNIPIQLPQQIICGTGTILNENNQCVPDLANICGPQTILQGNMCVVDPAITQQITDLEALVQELENRIAELLALLNIFAPITEAECADIQATIDQKIADGKNVPPKLLSDIETCTEIYG